MVDAGDAAPDFMLADGAGDTIKLSGFRGKSVVLYFYPKDSTPGCTREACDFRDGFADVSEVGVEVFGVSPDGASSHRKFASKHELPFRLLSDPEHEVADAYGAWGEKTFMGRKSMGIIRSTFLIDAGGTIRKVWRKVRVKGHAAEVLEAAKALA
jgi:peroxiredoxin Q/BCP